MDVATVVGLILGLVLVFGSIALGVGIGPFIDIPSMVIVGGGTIAAVMISFPMQKVVSTGKVIKKSFQVKNVSPAQQIERMAEFAALARKEGILALEEKLDTVDDAFMVKGLRLVVDGFPPELVRDILGIDLHAMQERHICGKAILDKMGEASPAFGMIGTLIGLIAMLKNLSDPTQIGGGMAIALLTTFYGAFLANVIFLPLATKLEQRKKEETMMREIVVEGIAAIQSGDKPQMVKEKLKAFLSPVMRQEIEKAALAAKGG